LLQQSVAVALTVFVPIENMWPEGGTTTTVTLLQQASVAVTV
jgi:hypothetical protein